VFENIYKGIQSIKNLQEWLAVHFFDISSFLLYIGMTFIALILTSFGHFYIIRGKIILGIFLILKLG